MLITFRDELRTSLAAMITTVATEKSVTLPTIQTADITVGIRSDFHADAVIYIEPEITTLDKPLKQWTARHGGRKKESSIVSFYVEYQSDKTDESIALNIGYLLHAIERVLEEAYPVQGSNAPYFLEVLEYDFSPTLDVSDSERKTGRKRFRKAGKLVVDAREDRGIGVDA